MAEELGTNLHQKRHNGIAPQHRDVANNSKDRLPGTGFDSGRSIQKD
jgi:hypothetical protein